MSAARSYAEMPDAAYLEVERAATNRHELIDGVVYAMAGGSFSHVRLGSRMLRSLGEQLQAGGCEAVGSDLRVKPRSPHNYFYPDVVVVCGEPEFLDGSQDTIVNPTAVVEVLSPSTERFDRGVKAEAYRSIPSLHTLVLVSQDKAKVEWFERAGDVWELREVAGLEGEVRLGRLEATIAMGDLYAGITFPEPEPERDPFEAAGDNGGE